jgi:virginiamycin A acetyltransferase
MKIRKKNNFENKLFFLDILKTIGNDTYLGNGTLIMNCSNFSNFCSISHNVKIGMDIHLLIRTSTNTLVCPMPGISSSAGKDVLISTNVVIMSSLRNGNGAVVGANSFVNRDDPTNAFVTSSPAKINRFRFNDKKINKIEHSKWLEKDIEVITKNKDESSNIDTLLM